MKQYSFPLDLRLYSTLFEPIRSKIDILQNLMLVIKAATITPVEANPDSEASIHIIVSKMSRIIIESRKNLYTIACPFSVNLNGDYIEFRTKSGIELDSFVSSSLISLLNDEDIFSGSIDDFAFPMLDLEISPHYNAWEILRELLLYEDGYLRFDHDEEHVKERTHPLDHLDIFYSTQSTFKLGLQLGISREKFSEILDNTSDRWFCISPPRALAV